MDRIIRIVLGIILLSLLFTDISLNKLGYIGILPLLTGLIGYCPLYSLFKVNTRSSN